VQFCLKYDIATMYCRHAKKKQKRLNDMKYKIKGIVQGPKVGIPPPSFKLGQADRAYGTEISPTSFVISFVILLYAISYNICI
jgi:hypothetical protein